MIQLSPTASVLYYIWRSSTRARACGRADYYYTYMYYKVEYFPCSILEPFLIHVGTGIVVYSLPERDGVSSPADQWLSLCDNTCVSVVVH